MLFGVVTVGRLLPEHLAVLLVRVLQPFLSQCFS